MTFFDEALISHLNTDSGLKTLVNERIYSSDKNFGEAFPCILYRVIDTPRELMHESNADNGDLVHPRIQFDVLAATKLEALTVAKALKTALHGVSGEIGVSPKNISIGACYLEDERDGDKLGDVLMFVRQLDFVFWYSDPD